MEQRTEDDIAKWPGSPAPGVYRKIGVGGRLFLEQYGPEGVKTWRVRVKVAGTDKEIWVGTWPAMALAEARANAARIALEAKGPASASDLTDLAVPTTDMWGTPAARPSRAPRLGAVATQYLQALPAGRAGFNLEAFQKRLGPLWRASIRTVREAQVEATLARCQTVDGEDAARALLANIQVVLRYAVRCGAIDESPVLSMAFRVQPEPSVVQIENYDRMPEYAVADWRQMGRILQASRFAPGHWQVWKALWAVAFTAQLPQEVVAMRWAHIDLERGLWHAPCKHAYPSHGKGAGTVPLSTQMMDLLRGIERRSEYVFYSTTRQDAPLSLDALNCQRRRYLCLVAHQYSLLSWRPALANWLRSADAPPGLYEPDCLAFLLDQAVAPPARGLTEKRLRAMLQAWADMLIAGVQRAAG